MANTKTRVLSLLMALALIFSLLPISAFASTDAEVQAQKQIVTTGGTAYYKANGTAGSASSYDVAVSKTIAATGTENLFDVTVNVQYKNATTETNTNTAATTLVIDTSGSMNWCSTCGANERNNTTLKNDYYMRCTGTDASGNTRDTVYLDADYDGACDFCGKSWDEHADWAQLTICTNKACADYYHLAKSRLQAAKDSACAFLDSYAKDASGAFYKKPHMVSLVTFAKSASTKDLGSEFFPEYWVDVTNADDLARVKDVINGLSASGGTNTQAGMNAAAALLNTTTYEDEIGGIANRFCVLLTDGKPTYHVGGGNGSDTTKDDTKGAEDGCKAVKDTGATLYAIAYGLSTEKVPVKGSNDQMLISTWLTSRCGATAAYTPSNAAALSAAFNSILNSTTTTGATSTGVADAVVPTTLASEDQFLQFVQFTSNANNADETADGNGAVNSGNAITWSLSNAIEDAGAPSGYTSYTMTYQVKLDNAKTGFAQGTNYALAPAALTYTDKSTTDNPSRTVDSVGYCKTGDAAAVQVSTVDPAQVKGYLGELSFNKVAAHDAAIALGNAPFSVSNLANTALGKDADTIQKETHSGTGIAPDNALGLVKFTGIPSGFSYNMKEEPLVKTGFNGTFTWDGKTYDCATTTWVVSVAYGEVKVNAAAPMTRVSNSLHQTYQEKTITKAWQRPDTNYPTGAVSVTVSRYPLGNVDAREAYGTLTVNGTQVSKTGLEGVTVKASVSDESWSYTLSNLPDNIPATGGSWVYEVAENGTVAGYGAGAVAASENGWTITNTATGKTDITVNKVWMDIDGTAMSTAPVTLTLSRTNVNVQNAETVGTVTLNGTETTPWSAQWSDVDVYDSHGKVYTYTVSEAEGAAFQNVSIVKDANSNVFTVTNAPYDEKIPVTVTKTWKDDSENTDRPEVLVTLQRQTAAGAWEDVDTYTLKAADATSDSTVWAHTFDNLDKYEFTYTGNVITAVHQYTYRVEELTSVEGYTPSASGLNITNTRTGSVDLTVNKVWDDGFNSHPGTAEIALYREGGAVPASATVTNPVTITGNDSYTWSNLPQYDSDGKTYHYYVAETASSVESGFAVTYSNDGGKFVNGEVTVTNTLTTEPDTTAVTVNKIWNQPTTETTHPAVTFTLVQTDAEGKSVNFATYTMTDGTTSHTFDAVPANYAVQDKETGAVSYENYTYTVTESDVSGYISNGGVKGADSNIWTFTNTRTGTMSLTANKVWKDLETDSAKRPEAEITLYRTDSKGVSEQVSGAETLTTKIDADKTWSSVAKYDADGQYYTYYVVEKSLSGYSTTYSDPQNQGKFVDGRVTVTNTVSQGTTQFIVSKYWVDGSVAKDRGAITLELTQNNGTASTVYGTAVIPVTGAVTTTGSVKAANVDVTREGDVWTVTFRNLDKYAYNKDGSVTGYTYSADETAVPTGYTKSVVDNGSAIYNTLDQTETSVTIHKLWVDPDGSERPAATFTLIATAGGKTLAANAVTGYTIPTSVTLTASNAQDAQGNAVSADADNWYYTFAKLPLYDNNRSIITYTVSEGDVAGYTKEQVSAYYFKNTIEQGSVTINGSKTWVNNQTGDYVMPGTVGSIQVALFLGGALVTEDQTGTAITNPMTVTAGADGKWNFNFGTFDQYDLTTGAAKDYKVYEVYYATVDGKQILRKVDGTDSNKTIVYGEDTYTVSYELSFADRTSATAITNTYQEPQEYFYKVIRNYTTTLGNTGETIFTATDVSEGVQSVASNDAAVTVDPAAYTNYNGVDFTFKDAQFTEGEFTLGNAVYTVELDQINHLYTITLQP